MVVSKKRFHWPRNSSSFPTRHNTSSDMSQHPALPAAFRGRPEAAAHTAAPAQCLPAVLLAVIPPGTAFPSAAPPPCAGFPTGKPQWPAVNSRWKSVLNISNSNNNSSGVFRTPFLKWALGTYISYSSYPPKKTTTTTTTNKHKITQHQNTKFAFKHRAPSQYIHACVYTQCDTHTHMYLKQAGDSWKCYLYTLMPTTEQ